MPVFVSFRHARGPAAIADAPRRPVCAHRGLVLLLGLLVCFTGRALRADEFDILREKWVDMTTGGSAYQASDPVIASAIASVTSSANGYWTSMNKAAGRTSLWTDAASATVSADINTNYSRLRTMAIAYMTTGSTLQGSAALRDDIVGGLDWMYANRYNENVRIYDNWWHFEIGSPLALNDIVALLYAELSPTRIGNYMRTVDKFTPSATTPAAGGSSGTFTGANRMWKIQVVAVRGLIVKDDAKLRAARDAFSNLFVYVTSGDGFYRDGSFLQHGKHPYTGGYGAALLSNISQVLQLLNGPNSGSSAGSSWRVTDPNLVNVYRWVYDAYEPLIYRGGMMAMTEGREVSRSGSSEHGTGHTLMQSILRISDFAAAEEDRRRMRAMVRGWAESDTSRSFLGTAPLALKPDIQRLLADATLVPREELRGSIVFASMDRVVHLGLGYGIGLALSSARIYNYESINGENLRGWYTGDGMMYLYNGDLVHYSDGFWPTVNPRRLPGTTVDAGQTRAAGSGQSTAPSPTWAGGTTLGAYGAAGMQLAGWGNTLTARKSWFMFDGVIVCLGAGISSSDNRTIETTVENRLLATNAANVFTVDGAAQPATLGRADTLRTLRWAHLAGRTPGAEVGYFFPGSATVQVVREARTGAWSDVNRGGSTASLTRNYLTLWFDHGANPVDGQYAYVVLPGRTAVQVASYASSPTIEVLENSRTAQTVREASLGITAVNIWNDGRTTSGGITVDRKASLLMRETNGTLEVAVSDPTQANSSTITIELPVGAQALVRADPGVTIAQLMPTVRLTVAVGNARGRPFRAQFTTAGAKAPAALSNLSTRAYLSGGDDALFAGFVIAGPGTKRVLVRAVGPTLGAFGVTGVLANPRLAIVNEAGFLVAENSDWGAATNAVEMSAAFSSTGAFALERASRDAAVWVALPAGAYSAVVRDEAGSGGVVLVEVYDSAPATEPRLVNLSSRVFSGNGAQTAIVGFSLSGDAPRQLLVRAAGPALAGFGVSGPLPDPQLIVMNAEGRALVQNDNWAGSANAAELAATAEKVGAFAFAPTARDAAASTLLAPGGYTAVVTDAAIRTGNALVEVYLVP